MVFTLSRHINKQKVCENI